MNKIPERYLGHPVICQKCQGEYSAIEDVTGAKSTTEKKKEERSALLLGTAIIIGIPVLMIGGCKFLGDRTPDAEQTQEVKRQVDSKPRQSKDHGSRTTRRKPSKWYRGGSLHQSNMSEWREASYENRLATAADFSATLVKQQGKSFADINELKPRAIALEIAITEAGRGGIADNQKVSAIAAASWMLLDR
ncbi:hypothetical protein N9F24_01225 [Akkermansiaceae bacterium]|nr:hypothetical protein [Akkermansiaceae bacterium]